MRLKIIVLLGFLSTWSMGFSQKDFSVNIAIEYENVYLETGQGNVFVGFSPNHGNWNEEKGMPVISISEKVSFSHAKFILEDFTSEVLDASELKVVNTNNIEREVVPRFRVVTQRFQSFFIVDLDAVFYNNQTGNYEKILTVSGRIQEQNIPIVRAKSFKSNSVLSSGSGEWYRIGVSKSGLFKIDYNFLNNNGVNTSGLNSSQISLYGNDQGMLSHQNADEKIDDLAQQSIYMKDGGDGQFDAGDYFVFYANGPHEISAVNGEWTHEKNNYSDTAYYFINISTTSNGLTIQNASLATGTPTHTVSTFTDYQFLENDDINLAKSGTEWLGDIYDVQLSNSYNFVFPNLQTSDSILVNTRVGISSPVTYNSSCEFVVSCGGASIITKPANNAGSGQGSTSPKCRFASSSLKSKATGDNVNVSLQFNKNGLPSSVGYLDYIGVNTTRKLIMEGSQLPFANLKTIGTGNITEYSMTNASSVKFIWEITDPIRPKNVTFTRNGNELSFKVATDTLRKFIAFTDNQYFSPTFFGNVENQNLHGLESRDMIIVSAPEFYSAAQRLAAFHQTEGISSHIVNQQQIFNEFSSGMRDPVAIKQFLKMFYDRAAGDPTLAPRFCLIMGDCSYDYRNKLNSKSDFVITYESTESMAASTFSTDDFFVILDDTEGMNGWDLMDMAIGRLPVQTIQEAEGVVDKIISYSTVGNSGGTVAGLSNNEDEVLRDWRNVVTIISDDGDANAYFYDVENMATILESSHDELNITKLHSDAYQETVTPGGERNEDIEEAIRNRVQRGALLVNYIGHGGELGWAHEEILNVPTIQDWTNTPKFPVFMTATCEFSRYDDHDRVSAGEYVVLNKNGGGIGLFTTTRLVFTTDNRKLAEYFYDTVADKINSAPQFIGDIYKGAKNKYSIKTGSNEGRKFTFLGDPAVKLALPQLNVLVDSVNGTEVSVFTDTLKALSHVSISGHIEDDLGNPINNFNGLIFPTIYDKISELSTLANTPGTSPLDFTMWKNIVYKGKATVSNGKFRFEFIVPQDISYNYGAARLSFYAENGTTDGNGVDESPLIGGINTDAPEDNLGPEIDLYMNNEKFVNGGITDENPIFIANVFDANGINMVGNGIGHNIEIRIDNASEPIILNDYYESDVDTYKSGEVRFQLNDVEPGGHIIKFKIWDVYNNSSDAEIEFTVMEEKEIAIEHLLNYPNPFTTSTEFSFEHNQVGDFLDVQLQIFTITGKVVKSIEQRVITDGFRVDGIHWDGRDDFGDKIGIGTYVYKMTVVNEAGASLEKYEKLVILN